MYAFFDDAKFNNTDQFGILAFCIVGRSPGVKVLQRLLTLMADAHNVFWNPVRGLGGWTDLKFTFVAALCYRALGFIFTRLIYNNKHHKCYQERVTSLCQCVPK